MKNETNFTNFAQFFMENDEKYDEKYDEIHKWKFSFGVYVFPLSFACLVYSLIFTKHLNQSRWKLNFDKVLLDFPENFEI